MKLSFIICFDESFALLQSCSLTSKYAIDLNYNKESQGMEPHVIS